MSRTLFHDLMALLLRHSSSCSQPEILAKLVINERYFSQVAVHIEPYVRNWVKRAKARVRDQKPQDDLELN